MTLGIALPPHRLMDNYGPTSALPEAELWRGYSRPTFRREPCLCGRWIMAATGERSIAEGVQRHNLSTAHAQWAIAAGWR